MSNQNENKFDIVAERTFFWNFIVNVVIVFTLIIINIFKPNSNSISNATLEIILDFMITTTLVFAGTYIMKYLGNEGKEILNKVYSLRHSITDKGRKNEPK